MDPLETPLTCMRTDGVRDRHHYQRSHEACALIQDGGWEWHTSGKGASSAPLSVPWSPGRKFSHRSLMPGQAGSALITWRYSARK